MMDKVVWYVFVNLDAVLVCILHNGISDWWYLYSF